MDEAPRALRAVDMGVSVDMGVRLLRAGLRSSRAGDRRPTVCAMNIERPLRDALHGAVPSLRAFAISLTNDPIRADDLVQDTLLRALSRIDQFERGTNLNAWLFTILRNLFHTEYRKRKREVQDGDGAYAARLATPPEQNAHLDFGDLRVALAKLSPDQREAVLLIGAEGFSYE